MVLNAEMAVVDSVFHTNVRLYYVKSMTRVKSFFCNVAKRTIWDTRRAQNTAFRLFEF